MDHTPHNIQFDTGVGNEREALFTIATHPSTDIIATGDISGHINLYSYTSNAICNLLHSLNHLESDTSCRALQFSHKGTRLFCGTKGKVITSTNIETGQLLKSTKNAHFASIYSLLTVSEGVLISGDENGEIKIWDTRSWKTSSSFKENCDFISSMVVDDSQRTLITTSGDGSLCAFDLRQRRLEQRSDCNESELLSVAIIKGGKKVVCGDGEGALMIYNWGLWGDITDRFPSHPQSIDCMVALNDSVVCTGCMDGMVRSIQILPNKTLGIIGQQSPTALSIDTMCLTHDQQFLVTGSQDSCRFWPVGDIPTLPSDRPSSKRKQEQEQDIHSRQKRKKQRRDNIDKNFFADL